MINCVQAAEKSGHGYLLGLLGTEMIPLCVPYDGHVAALFGVFSTAFQSCWV